MSEQPVFWLGGKPGRSNASREPKAASYEPVIREACEKCDYQVDEYISAMGSFGGWLTHLSQDGEKYRLFFNGKQNQLAFEKSQKHGGWELLSSIDIPDEGVAGFVVAVNRLLKVD